MVFSVGVCAVCPSSVYSSSLFFILVDRRSSLLRWYSPNFWVGFKLIFFLLVEKFLFQHALKHLDGFIIFHWWNLFPNLFLILPLSWLFFDLFVFFCDFETWAHFRFIQNEQRLIFLCFGEVFIKRNIVHIPILLPFSHLLLWEIPFNLIKESAISCNMISMLANVTRDVKWLDRLFLDNFIMNFVESWNCMGEWVCNLKERIFG